MLRVRVLTKNFSIRLAAKNSPLSIIPGATNGIMMNELVMPDNKYVGHDALHPDWKSLSKTNFGYEGNRYASVMCWVSEAGFEAPDMGFNRCPRTILRRILEQAKDAYGLELLIGFEIEFMLMDTLGDGKRYPMVAEAGHYTASGIRNKAFRYVEECVDALREMNVEVQQFHSEGASGQFEISTGPLPVIEAIDTLVLTHETIKNVLARHGHQATMYPKPFADHPGNGAHTHISIEPTHMEREFLAGLLHRLPNLCAFTLPSPESYTRIKAREAGESVGWGTLDRNNPVRKMKPGHWELRCMDATANMYLALAACISAGLLGIRDKEDLIWMDGASSEYFKLSDHEKLNLGIYKPLPKSLSEAVRQLKADWQELDVYLGTCVIERYIKVKEHEENAMGLCVTEADRQMYLARFS